MVSKEIKKIDRKALQLILTIVVFFVCGFFAGEGLYHLLN